MNGKVITDSDEFTKEQKIWLLAVCVGGAMRKADIGMVLEVANYLAELVTKEDGLKALEMTKNLKAKEEPEPPDLDDPGIQTSFPI